MMRLEEELKEAMREHVADVHASPVLGAAIRRRRRRVARGRVTSLALATAAIVAAVPAYVALNQTASFQASPTGTANVAQVQASAAETDLARETGLARETELARETDLAREAAATVPNVVGMKAKQARKVLEKAGLKVKTVRKRSKIVPAGMVIKQDPAAGAKRKRGAVVTVTVAR